MKHFLIFHKKHPVQDKVDDQQGCEYQARGIMHG
jgi:hypothetical protein